MYGKNSNNCVDGLCRDMKPENLLVDVNCSNGTALKAIDFGSSCDWATPFKKGLRLATCDPVYTAPEQRLKMFSPAYRFDIYSIGLITLRCALPSLLEKRQMSNFVENYMSKFNYSLVRTTAAILSKRIEVPQPLLFDMQALTNDTHADLYATLAVMLTESPEQRADIQDCLNSRFLRRFL